MDRHLGFLDVPQPSDPDVKVLQGTYCFIIHGIKCVIINTKYQNLAPQIFATGETIKFQSSFRGFANDWIYRTEVTHTHQQ